MGLTNYKRLILRELAMPELPVSPLIVVYRACLFYLFGQCLCLLPIAYTFYPFCSCLEILFVCILIYFFFSWTRKNWANNN
jgi:hypothetical protein